MPNGVMPNGIMPNDIMPNGVHPLISILVTYLIELAWPKYEQIKKVEVG